MHTVLLADAGVPMIFVQWPLMLCALVPVIVIEALVVRHRLALSYRKAFVGAAKANTLSTLAGVPLARGLMLVVELVTAFPLIWAAEKWHWHPFSPILYVFYVLAIAWTGPPATSWAPIALASALLLVPTFFVSVWLERRSYRRSWSDLAAAAVDRSVWSANLCSYTLLFITACGWLGWEVYKGPTKAPAVRRMREHPVDLAYLHDVAIPSADPVVRPKLLSSVTELEAYLADLDVFMRDVEQGKIAVIENLSTGRWRSYIASRDSSTFVTYFDKVAPVENFRKENKDRKIYDFDFNRAGYVERAEMPPDDVFEFDEIGRLEHWHREKWNYWGHPGEK